LTILQFIAGGLLEGGTVLVGVAAMDCVAPELTGSSHAMAAFFAQSEQKFLNPSIILTVFSWSFLRWSSIWFCNQDSGMELRLPDIRISWCGVYITSQLSVDQEL